MRESIGCAGSIAAVAFVIGVIGSLFSSDASLGQRLAMALMPAAFAFVAALILCARDRARATTAMQAVRQKLLARNDVNENEFVAHFPAADSQLIAQIRQAIALFYDVPVERIHPTDQLRNDLRCDIFEPALHFAVICYVADARNYAPQPVTFNTAELANIGDLIKEVQRVLDGFDTIRPSDNG